MPSLWRISNHDDLTGLGGERSEGRWHTAGRGKRIVYLAEHPAVALVEALANLKGTFLLPSEYQLMKVKYDEDLATERIDAGRLSAHWRDTLRETQALGNDWLASGASALLAVPSAPSPESFNFLLNPVHPDARRVQKEWCKWLTYDKRLFRAT